MVDDVQGDVVPGFRRRTDRSFHQSFVFARVTDLTRARRGLKTFRDRISTWSDVDAARQKASGDRRDDAHVNLALTAKGLLRFLGMNDPPNGLGHEPFFEGLAARSVDKHLLGDPKCWEVGGPEPEIHVMLNLGAQRRARVDASIADARVAFGEGLEFLDDLQIDAALRPGGIEHFGFRDGLGGPVADRSLLSEPPDAPGRSQSSSFPRMSDLAYTSPASRTRGGSVEPKPAVQPIRTTASGRPILPIRRFVLEAAPGPARRGLAGGGRAGRRSLLWRNGSFLVWLRLRQDAKAFREACASIARRLTEEWSWPVSTEEAAALLVGRRRDGTPLTVAPLRPAEAFTYLGVTQIESDPWGYACPLGAHARKMNPRTHDEILEHSILRRGIPYRRTGREVEAGLAFLCYQASIAQQYETLQGTWANSPNHPEVQGSPDAMIGDVLRRGAGTFEVAGPEGTGSISFGFKNTWVEPKGGLYLFVPSVTALSILAKAHGRAERDELLLGR
jgi:deferrochelatase/peroxidase EfeB